MPRLLGSSTRAALLTGRNYHSVWTGRYDNPWFQRTDWALITSLLGGAAMRHIVVLLAALVFLGCSEKAKEVGNKVKGEAKEVGAKVKEGAKEVGAKVKDVAKDVGAKVKEEAKVVGEKVK